VKGLLAIFFSVALIVSQATPSLNAPLSSTKHKASGRNCCGECGPCKGSSCCVANNDSESRQPLPAVPTQNVSQIDLQALTLTSLLAWEQTPAESAVVPISVFVPPSIAAPLYQRNCSYLI